VAISFLEGQPAPVARFAGGLAEPNEHGRTGAVSAGCVFWMKSVDQTFATIAEDHANCSVGSYTHGLLSLEAAATRDDIAAVLASGWVSLEAFKALPKVSGNPETIVYGPLADAQGEPDVVLVRLSPLGMMLLRDAFPNMSIEGKPQCHIVAIAKEQGVAVASVGCALSRARTGMKAEEGTAAIPGHRLAEIVATLEGTADLDWSMARYAAADAKRFG
jgi:uncharacterized protein (DUF169 family)